MPGPRSESDIQSGVDALHDLVQRFAVKPEDAVVQSGSDRTHQRDLRASTSIQAEVGLLPCAEAFPIRTSAARQVELDARDRDRRLE